MNRTVLILLIIALACIVVGGILLAHGFLSRSKNPPLPTKQFMLGTHTLTVEVADTALTRMRGLSGRTGLAPDHGMLFVFPTAGSYGFWMKDMQFPLDFVWIADGTVVGITPDVPAPTSSMLSALKTYYPPSAVDTVLEIKTGEAARIGVAVGAPARFVP
jgi:uncharacterized membrane protein (UPF0127 family)